VTIASAARDHEIQQLNERGWSQRRIAHQVGITQAGVSHALKRLAGTPRPRKRDDGPHPTGDPARATDPSTTVRCTGCGRLSWKNKRNPATYLCADCRRTMSSPPTVPLKFT
jgi:hypothetical protein